MKMIVKNVSTCRADNAIPVWSDADMYAMLKAELVKDAGRIGDPEFERFDEFYFFKTPAPTDGSKRSKEDMIGGKERMWNKFGAASNATEPVSIYTKSEVQFLLIV